MKVKVWGTKDNSTDNEVANMEVVIDEENNNDDYINDVLIPMIHNTGFRAIGGEIKWTKNDDGENVLRVFGATEGRTTMDQVVKTLSAA